MARMVFGRSQTALGKPSQVTHYIRFRSERGQARMTVCGHVYSVTRMQGFSGAPEKAEQMTTCKNCRREMGWATPTDQRSRR